MANTGKITVHINQNLPLGDPKAVYYTDTANPGNHYSLALHDAILFDRVPPERFLDANWIRFHNASKNEVIQYSANDFRDKLYGQ